MSDAIAAVLQSSVQVSISDYFSRCAAFLGSLPGFDAAEPSDADVQTALAAMAIQDDGTSKLDYFIQAYRAGDFPFYADYAVHRATEVLAGPRQIVVTK